MLPVEIEAQVQRMAGWQPVVVPGGYQVGITGRVERRCHHNPPFRKRGCTARSEIPGGAYVELLIELVIHQQVHVVSTVIAVRETLSVVDGREQPVAFGKGITQPAGSLSHRLLDEEFNAHCPACPHFHLVLPAA